MARTTVYYFMWRRRNRAYRDAVWSAMTPKNREAFAHTRDVANAWIFVAGGASLIAVKETWELHEQYHWAFWALGRSGTSHLCSEDLVAHSAPSN